jgi:hypothetical protein
MSADFKGKMAIGQNQEALTAVFACIFRCPYTKIPGQPHATAAIFLPGFFEDTRHTRSRLEDGAPGAGVSLLAFLLAPRFQS